LRLRDETFTDAGRKAQMAGRKATSNLKFQLCAALRFRVPCIKNLFASRWCVACAVASLILTTACAQQMSQEPKFKPLEPSSFFKNNSSARAVVEGTVARDYRKEEAAQNVVTSGDAYTNSFPFPVTREILERGRERYNINCAVCHGYTGYGDGMIVRRGFSPPPSFHTDIVRRQPIGFYFDVITNGYGAMGRYGYQVGARDRWAIIAYIRALQLSQNATFDDVPPEERAKLQAKGGG